MDNRCNEPKFARESFSWRRMQPWQIAALAIVVIAFLLGVVVLA